MHSTQAILLRKHRLTESSLIVSWLTPEFGRIKTVAKGALRSKSKFLGVLDLFHLCEIQYNPARNGDLHGLRDASLLDSFPGLRTEYTRVALASYGIELLERFTESETPVPELFHLLFRALRFLNAQQATQKAMLHFEAELARLLGIAEPDVAAARTLERLHRLPLDRDTLLHRLRS